MKVKTSITLSDYLLKTIDTMIGEYGNRSQIIEEALKQFISHKKRKIRDNKDLELINKNSDFLNKEAHDTLLYQAKM